MIIKNYSMHIFHIILSVLFCKIANNTFELRFGLTNNCLRYKIKSQVEFLLLEIFELLKQMVAARRKGTVCAAADVGDVR